jgi:hypothetical protein
MPSVARTEDQDDGLVTVITTTCPGCQHPGRVRNVKPVALNAWLLGAHIQDVMPELSDADRELLISGMHSDCFDSLFPPDEDD